MSYRYCPVCGTELTLAHLGGRERECCADPRCGHVFWDNPVPVVGAIVEHQGKIIIAHNVLWPTGMYGLVTGFLERDESPEEGIVREVKEELNLDGEVRELVGLYPFKRKNQLIMAFHVVTEPGDITLNEELDVYKALAPEQVRYWPAGTGWAIKDWLEARGHAPQEIDMSPQLRTFFKRD